MVFQTLLALGLEVPDNCRASAVAALLIHPHFGEMEKKSILD